MSDFYFAEKIMNNYIKSPFVLTVSGANGSGKSHFIKYTVKSFPQEFDFIVVFSNTADMNGDYNFLECRKLIVNPIYYEEIIMAVMKIQKKNIQSGLKRKVLMIFDDVMGSIKDSKIMKTLVSQNRHFGISIIFSVQYINQAATYLREIANYDVIFELKTMNSLKSCYENYFATDFPTFSAFKEKISKTLKHYQFFFADKLTGSKCIMMCPPN